MSAVRIKRSCEAKNVVASALSTLFRKAVFRLRWHNLLLANSALRRVYWRSLGMKIGPNTRLSTLRVTWPHRVLIGARCTLEHSIYLNVAGGYVEEPAVVIGDECFVGSGCEFNVLGRVQIGKSCLIASGTRFVDHNHGIQLGTPMKQQAEQQASIIIGDDVWIGANCLILKGVEIGSGAIVGAGAIVTKSVPPLAIVVGPAARFLRQRE